ncbi:DNA helicase [[Phormidium ambiguum] IAM M-71]|uniref:DNA helicase n=2 Tax=[Phormidium ambiguum] IAM M-71 TaxID=454136 RepID=A0A1U7IGQ8_9CYAN|nr:DNA helicase [Phormidium ambiguum IAM M-71]
MIQTLIGLNFQLTSQQEVALKKIAEFLTSSKRMFGLFGYAGTGKSTIVNLVAEQLVSAGKRVVFTAPTNKAVGVLRRMAAEKKVQGVDLMTIHQLLGLAPVKQGQQRILKQVSSSLLYMYDIIFLDECSMVTEELWNIIEERINNALLLGSNRQLIVMGDPAQLPPVNEEINERKSQSFNVPDKTILTEVVRQGTGSPLLEFVTACRIAVKSKKVFEPFSKFNPDKKNGAFLVKEQTLLKYALKKFSTKFNRDPDCFRLLCYTNERVAYWNQKIRAKIYGKDAPKFVIGERLISKAPVIAPDGKTIILATSTEVEVVEFVEDRYSGYKAWNVKVKTEAGELRQIYILHEDDVRKFKRDNNRLLRNAKRNPSLWKAWYEHCDTFADMRNCWAITVHNSQGSTFIEVGIDSKDIRRKVATKLLYLARINPDRKAEYLKEYRDSVRACNQLFYVGASRARNRVFINT